jgi:hypothetical protein
MQRGAPLSLHRSQTSAAAYSCDGFALGSCVYYSIIENVISGTSWQKERIGWQEPVSEIRQSVDAGKWLMANWALIMQVLLRRQSMSLVRNNLYP